MEPEVVHTENKKFQGRPLNKAVAIVFSIPIVLHIILFGLGGLKVLVQIYDMSLAAGLVLTFTGIPLAILFAGVYVMFGSFGWYEKLEYIENAWEYYFKLIGYYIGSFILGWLAYGLGSILFIWIASIISS